MTWPKRATIARQQLIVLVMVLALRTEAAFGQNARIVGVRPANTQVEAPVARITAFRPKREGHVGPLWLVTSFQEETPPEHERSEGGLEWPDGEKQEKSEPAARNAPDATKKPTAASENTLQPLDYTPSILNDLHFQGVSLSDLIFHSVASKRILNSIAGTSVIIENATIFDAELAETLIATEQSRFDPNYTATIAGNDVNRPPRSFFGPGLQQSNKRDEGEFNVRLSKVFPTGLTSSIGYEPSLAYLFFPDGNSSGFNPTHSSDLVVRLNQPLMRGAGRDVNLATVRIAEQRTVLTRLQIETAMQAQLRSIEQVYWTLHAEYVRLQALDEAIGLARRTVHTARTRFEGERAIYSDVARAGVQLEGLYQQRLDSERRLRQASFDLMQLAGLDGHGTTLFVPLDVPERRSPVFDARSVVDSAVGSNPEIRRRRQEIAIRHSVVSLSGNQILPQFDLVASHRTSGLEDDLGSSLQQMLRYEFNDFSLGLQFTQQLGMRRARSQWTAAQLEVSRAQATLEALERQVGFDLLQGLTAVNQSYANYESALRQLCQTQRWVQLAKLRYEDPPLSDSDQSSSYVSLLDYQTALQAKVDAIVQVARAIAEYNTSLAVIEEKRGRLLERWHIATMSVGEGGP